MEISPVEITAKWNINLRDLFGSTIERLMSKRLWTRLGNLQRFRMKDRTAKGVDINNQPFTPYSESYADKRREAGFQIGKVDLNRSGRMWASLSQEAHDESVEIFFAGEPAARAHGHNFGVPGRLPQREFFGISDDDRTAIIDEILKNL